jgi:hypothetical protein
VPKKIKYATINAMTPIGDGFLGSLEHKHFLKAFAGFVVIVLLVWATYFFWVKKQSEIEAMQVQQFQAQQ